MSKFKIGDYVFLNKNSEFADDAYKEHPLDTVGKIYRIDSRRYLTIAVDWPGGRWDFYRSHDLILADEVSE